MKLTNGDVDIMDIKMDGLESDCVFKANERMILKAFLNHLTVEDLSEMTLYNKVVQLIYIFKMKKKLIHSILDGLDRRRQSIRLEIRSF